MFDAEDWLKRFAKAGCRMDIDPVTMRPGADLADECKAIWDEIAPESAPGKAARWQQVYSLVNSAVGGVGVGWKVFPPNR